MVWNLYAWSAFLRRRLQGIRNRTRSLRLNHVMVTISEMESKLCRRCGVPLAGPELSGNCPRCLTTLLLGADSSAPAESSPAPVLRRIGDYELLEEIARGGMGVVFRARQMGLDRVVAVKLLRDSALAQPEEVKRFRSEAAAVGRLKHPNIVAIHDVGEEHGQHFLAMDLVAGPNLAQFTRDGPLEPRRAAEITARIADAVQHAHAQGILHRDLKPSNILMDTRGEVFVTDFGLARPLDSGSSLTLSGQVLGTPAYMSPEQAGGRSDSVGPTADVYSMGALLFHLLTGRPPFVSNSLPELMRLVAKVEPLSPQLLNSLVPRDLATVCLKCLAKHPTDRYGSAREVEEDLRLFLGDKPVRARPASRSEQLWRWCRREPALAASLSLALFILIMGGSVATWQWQRARVEADHARLNAYEADMNLAQHALDESNLGHAVELLEHHRPVRGQKDRRGWEWRYLWYRSRSDELRTLGRHSDLVSAIAFTRDGTRVASGSLDGTVRFWDTATWNELSPLKLPARVRAITFSPDGNTLAVGTMNSQVTIWDWKSGRQETALDISVGQEEGALLFTKDGTALLAGGAAGLLEVRKLPGYETIHKLEGHLDWVNALALSPDGKILASGGSDRAVKLWDTETWQLKATLPAPVHPYQVRGVAFSPDAKSLLTVGAESNFKVWNIDRLECVFVGETKDRELSAGVFSPNGTLIATSGTDQTVELWSAFDGGEAARLHGHRDDVPALAFSPDGKTIVSGGRDGWVKLWPVAKPRARNPFQPHAKGVFITRLSRDGQIALVQYPQDMAIVETAGGQELGRISLKGGLVRGAVNSAIEGGKLALGRTDGVVELFRLHPLRKEAELSGLHVKDVETVAISHDGRLVASVDFDGQVQVREWSTARRVAQWKVPGGRCSVAFAPDDRLLAVGRGDGGVELCNLGNRQSLATLRRQEDAVPGPDWSRVVLCLSFSPDGRTLAVGSRDSATTLWDTVTRRMIAILGGHRSGVLSAAFSPDAARLATADGNGTLILWNLESRQQVLTLRGHPEEAFLAFTDKGRTLVSVSVDGIRHWHAPTIEQIENEATATDHR